ncbi:hypothetical protein GCM10009782_50290 [Glycomyces algeriensis]
MTTPDTHIFIATRAVKMPPHVRGMTRLRDVLSQNPNRVRDPPGTPPAPPKKGTQAT